METTTIIGFVAAVLTTSAFVPQAVKTWKTRSTSDLSLPMYLMMFIGISLWLIYGLSKNDWPIILANGVSFCLAFVILYFKIREVLGVKNK